MTCLVFILFHHILRKETVSRDSIVNERPDAIINLLEANLERNLYLTIIGRLFEAGRPVVVGLNMIDLLKERGDVIGYESSVRRSFGVPVIEASVPATNVNSLVKAAIEAGKKDVPAQGPKY